MTHAPSRADRIQALDLRLCEAALEPAGWRAVARALQAELGTRIEFEPEDPAAPAATAGTSNRLAVPGLGTWALGGRSGGDGEVEPPPVLREALALALRLRERRPLVQSELEAVLDPLPYAAILMDASARLVFANHAGEDLLASRRFFRSAPPGARLHATDRRADEALESAMARILTEGSGPVGWTTSDPASLGHLAIRLTPIGARDREADRASGPTAHLLMTVREIGPAGSAAAKAAEPAG